MCMQLKNALEFSIIIIIYRKQNPKKTLCGLREIKSENLPGVPKMRGSPKEIGPMWVKGKAPKKPI